MGRLIYSAITSLDGCVADEHGGYDWAAPSEPVHAFLNDLEREIGTYLLGRRTYAEMIVWDALPLADQPRVMRDFAGIWLAADKVVYSGTLESVSTGRTRLERDFDPAEVRRLKESSAADLTVGGPGLAAAAFRAGLVDECQLFVKPVLVGGGLRAFPDGVGVGLDLRAQRRFEDGTVHLRYDVRS
ncbi:dihydrofolate reductase family protein [Saccharopolyspora sp. NFXS83]|uniref:dihydrofolate reductase family protein n=1 Tax=Saccharopolyspora sp. NFXS83 TaxID=2993560 RepID=UPI00224ABC4D|nr:dihydrofolate reductase family protein [Saccharopolyspora sp. NFXS83]MCX2729775.1 dihydrofolate reductase family protein [Saccharopolyspora sp. NFXS83]